MYLWVPSRDTGSALKMRRTFTENRKSVTLKVWDYRDCLRLLETVGLSHSGPVRTGVCLAVWKEKP